MIEIPKELKRFIIKVKFRDLNHRAGVDELDKLARTDDIKNLLFDFEHLIDVDFTDSEPGFDITNNSFSVGWFGFMKSQPIRVDIVWDYSGDKFRNYILATDEGGEEKILKEL